MSNLQTQSWSGQKSRQVEKRVIVEGTLVLQTPAHFGSGDDQGSVMPLIFDEARNQALLTGASIAGALRGYLWNLKSGYRQREINQSLTTRLFGGSRQDDKGNQSSLIIDDAYGEDAKVELRDGVKIEGKSNTAEDSQLYSFMVWAEGAKFDLRFELFICDDDKETELKQALASALNGFQNGEITLGARKHRGFGRISVNDWRVREFDMYTTIGLIAWVGEGGQALTASNSQAGTDIFDLLKTSNAFDNRKRFTLKASFDLESSVLIRAESTVADMGHLRSNGKPIVSGTSLAGAIRARALKIANTLKIKESVGIIEELFGAEGDDKKANGIDSNQAKKRSASRITIQEREINGGETEKWVQSRVAIDRFTAGALDTALFNQQPKYGGKVQINLEVRNPQKREIGLLLLVLKDLWTADLALGGECSVGRGRLCGQKAELNDISDGKGRQNWTITKDNVGKLKIEGDEFNLLQTYVDELNKEEAAV